jgi:amino acid transporter
MTLKQLILQLVQIVIFFAFPTLWNWIGKIFPWWVFDPQTTLGIITGLVVMILSWLLGYLGIKKLVASLRANGLVVEK